MTSNPPLGTGHMVLGTTMDFNHGDHGQNFHDEIYATDAHVENNEKGRGKGGFFHTSTGGMDYSKGTGFGTYTSKGFGSKGFGKDSGKGKDGKGTAKDLASWSAKDYDGFWDTIANKEAQEAEKHKYGPDGFPIPIVHTKNVDSLDFDPSNHVYQADTAGGHDIIGGQRGWYEAESTRLQEERFARRNFKILCSLVNSRKHDGTCPDGRWINDPFVFPLNQPLTGPKGAPLPGWEGGVVAFPPNSKQFFVPPLQEPGTTKLEIEIKGARGHILAHHGRTKEGARVIGIAQNPNDPENPFVTRALKCEDEVWWYEWTEFLDYNADKMLFGACVSLGPNMQRHDYEGELPGEALKKVSNEQDAFEGVVLLHEVNDQKYGDHHSTGGWWGGGDDKKHQDAVLELIVLVKSTSLPKGPDHIAHQEAQDHKSTEEQKKIARRKKEMELTPWQRLTDYGTGSGGSVQNAHVFNDDLHDACDCGRVLPGALGCMYITEALNAISTRPKLTRQLFYAWDVNKAIYILKLMMNGTWVRVEIDDYVPPVPMNSDDGPQADEKPICSHSEWFPWVLWPSLVEKAYAKLHTTRPPYGNKGGWEAIGGAGRTEEVLADLTGGVAGRWSTRDVSPDRLFVYFYWLQRHCLWVARMNEMYRTMHNLKLSHYCSYVVKRAAHLEGHCFVQLFNSNMNFQGGGGLEAHIVPDDLIRRYPENGNGSYSWMSIWDFAQIFDTVIECRLTCSPDVGALNMPEPKLPMARALSSPLDLNRLHLQPEMQGLDKHLLEHMLEPDAAYNEAVNGRGAPLFFEHTFANRGIITEMNLPEFDVFVPDKRTPCEVVAVFTQTETQKHRKNVTQPPEPVLLKVYQHIDGNNYSVQMVCRSNWIPIRDSMVCFYVKKGGRFKIHAELPNKTGVFVKNVVFRCYTSQPDCIVEASKALMSHNLVDGEAIGAYSSMWAVKWSLVGCANPNRIIRADEPEPFDSVGDGAEPPPENDDDKCSVM